MPMSPPRVVIPILMYVLLLYRKVDDILSSNSKWNKQSLQVFTYEQTGYVYRLGYQDKTVPCCLVVTIISQLQTCTKLFRLGLETLKNEMGTRLGMQLSRTASAMKLAPGIQETFAEEKMVCSIKFVQDDDREKFPMLELKWQGT